MQDEIVTYGNMDTDPSISAEHPFTDGIVRKILNTSDIDIESIESIRIEMKNRSEGDEKITTSVISYDGPDTPKFVKQTLPEYPLDVLQTEEIKFWIGLRD